MKTIVFDFDGTLTKKSHEIWGKMWEAIDALDVDYELYCKYKNKEIDYMASYLMENNIAYSSIISNKSVKDCINCTLKL